MVSFTKCDGKIWKPRGELQLTLEKRFSISKKKKMDSRLSNNNNNFIFTNNFTLSNYLKIYYLYADYYSENDYIII